MFCPIFYDFPSSFAFRREKMTRRRYFIFKVLSEQVKICRCRIWRVRRLRKNFSSVIVVARRSHRCFPRMLSPIDHEVDVSDRSTATKQLHRKAENYTYRLKGNRTRTLERKGQRLCIHLINNIRKEAEIHLGKLHLVVDSNPTYKLEESSLSSSSPRWSISLDKLKSAS